MSCPRQKQAPGDAPLLPASKAPWPKLTWRLCNSKMSPETEEKSLPGQTQGMMGMLGSVLPGLELLPAALHGVNDGAAESISIPWTSRPCFQVLPVAPKRCLSSENLPLHFWVILIISDTAKERAGNLPGELLFRFLVALIFSPSRSQILASLDKHHGDNPAIIKGEVSSC